MPYQPRHRRSQKKPRRKNHGTAHERGYTSKWTKYSKSLRELPGYQECYVCGGPTHAIDHVVAPLTAGDRGSPEYLQLFWDENNHAPICETCNKKKGAGQDRDYKALWREWKKKVAEDDDLGF